MQQDNATQTGAEGLQPAHSGRNAALAQIAKAVNEGYQEDMQSFDESTGEIAPKPQAKEEKQESQAAVQQEEQQEEQKEEQQEEKPVVQAQTEEMETIVVDGQQVQVKRSQLFDAGRRTLQKEATADKRLQEATETLRRAQALEQSARQQYQPSQDAGTQNQSLPEQDATNRSGANDQTATLENFRALVRQESWVMNAETAAQRFWKEYPEIASDPVLRRYVGLLEQERLDKAAAEGLPLGDPWEAYKGHGDLVKAKFLKPAPAQVQVAGTEDRLERKRSTTTVVGAGVTKQASQPQKQLTTSEVIEQQRLARQRGRQIQPSR